MELGQCQKQGLFVGLIYDESYSGSATKSI